MKIEKEVPVTSSSMATAFDIKLSDTKIAFNSTLGKNSDVYVMKADASGQTRLTDDPAWDGDPSWSPSAPGVPIQITSPGWRVA